MGCYFTNYFAQSIPLSACFINPAVRPFERVEEYLNQDIVHNYTKEVFHLTEGHLKTLRSYEQNKPGPDSDFWVFLKTGDEVLNYKLAAEMYKEHKVNVDEGGDHSFHDYAEYIPEMIKWLCSKAHHVDPLYQL